jgi:hypothetical protein
MSVQVFVLVEHVQWDWMLMLMLNDDCKERAMSEANALCCP